MVYTPTRVKKLEGGVCFPFSTSASLMALRRTVFMYVALKNCRTRSTRLEAIELDK